MAMEVTVMDGMKVVCERVDKDVELLDTCLHPKG